MGLPERISDQSALFLAPVVDLAAKRHERGLPEVLKVPQHILGTNIGVPQACEQLTSYLAIKEATVKSVKRRINTQKDQLSGLRIALVEQFQENKLVVQTDTGTKDIFAASRRYTHDVLKGSMSRARALEKAFKTGLLTDEVFERRSSEQGPTVGALLEEIKNKRNILGSTRTEFYRKSHKYNRDQAWINPWLSYFQNQGQIEAQAQEIKANLGNLGSHNRDRFKWQTEQMLLDIKVNEYTKLGYERTQQLTTEDKIRAWRLIYNPRDVKVLRERLKEAEAIRDAQRPNEFGFKKFRMPLKANLVATARAALKEAAVQALEVTKDEGARGILESIQSLRRQVNQERKIPYDSSIFSRVKIGIRRLLGQSPRPVSVEASALTGGILKGLNIPLPTYALPSHRLQSRSSI